MGFTECNHLRAKLFTLHTISESSKQMALEVVELLKCQENKPSLRPSLWHGTQRKVCILSPTPPSTKTFKRVQVQRNWPLTNWRDFKHHTRYTHLIYPVYKIKLRRETFSVVQRKVYKQKVHPWLLTLDSLFCFFSAPILRHTTHF